MNLLRLFQPLHLMHTARGLTPETLATLRTFRHDCCNHFCAIDGLAQLGDYERIHTYIRDLMDSLGLDEPLPCTGNPALDGMLRREQARARQYGVRLALNTQALPPVEAGDYALTNLLSVLLHEGTAQAARAELGRREMTLTLGAQPGAALLTFVHPLALHRPAPAALRTLRRHAARCGGTCHYSVRDGMMCVRIDLPAAVG